MMTVFAAVLLVATGTVSAATGAERHVAKGIPCTACHYCTEGCPQHIAIPDLFATMNSKKLYKDWNADYYYGMHTGPGRRASDCLKCGKCEKACPQHLPIRQLLEEVAKEFEKK